MTQHTTQVRVWPCTIGTVAVHSSPLITAQPSALRGKQSLRLSIFTADISGVPHPLFVNSWLWKITVEHFATDDRADGETTDVMKPVCKRCYKAVLYKSINTSILAKPLSDRHQDRFKEDKTSGQQFASWLASWWDGDDQSNLLQVSQPLPSLE